MNILTEESNTQLIDTTLEQDEQTLSWFDVQDELEAERQGQLDYEELESQLLWEQYMERARTQSTSSDEEEEEKPQTLIGRKRRYSEIEESDDEEEEEEEEDSEEEEEYSDDDRVGNCGFRCDGRCRWCESGGYDPRDEI